MRFLFVDRILSLSPGQMVRGIKHVTLDDHYLCSDENGRLCFIPSLIGETLGQLAAWNVMLSNDFTFRPVAGVVGAAYLYRPAYVGETILLESFIDALDETAVRYHSIARVGEEEIFRIEDALGPLLPMDEFIDPDLIRQQFNEIDRPGEWEGLSKPHLANPMHPKGVYPHMEFDYITHCEAGVSMQAEKYINRAASYFPDHFPQKPVLPMTVLLECKLNLAKEFLRRSGLNSYHIKEMRKIKMNDFVQPGDVVSCYLQIKKQEAEQLILSFRSEVASKRVCVLDLILRKAS